MLRKLGKIALVIVPLLVLLGWAIGQYNTEQDVRISFENQYRNRTALYDKMWKTLKQKGVVASRNDTSFQNVVAAIMAGRKDGEGVAFKWIQEQNPGAQFTEVTRLYEDLSRTIEAERSGFFQQEKVLSDIKAEDDRLLRKFPGMILFKIYGTKPIDYKPITSDRTDDAIKTGKDNDTSVF